VVHVAGELDMATVPTLASYLREQTETSRPAHLVLDVAAVRYFASAGIALITSALRHFHGVRGELHLVGLACSRQAARLLDITGMLSVLDVHDDLDHLLHHLDQR
jgi:anti-anti-sigma factor